MPSGHDSWVELRTLRYFVAAAENDSLSLAADVVKITQPALSRQLAQFERTLGVRLFHRPGRRLELTAAGREFLPIARQVLATADEALRAAADLAAGSLRRITIAAPSTTLTDVIAPFLATFTRDDPRPEVLDADGPAALAALGGDADLAVVADPPPRGMPSRRVAVLPVYAYLPATHRWAGRHDVPLDALAGEPLILLDPSSRTRRLLDDALAHQEVQVGEPTVCSSPQVAQAMAAAGWGIAVVSDDPRFDLVPLPITTSGGPLLIRLWATWSPAHHAVDELSDLAGRLASFVADRYPGPRPGRQPA